jgi:glycosyltransferase involved in cell wall biosynthesis
MGIPDVDPNRVFVVVPTYNEGQRVLRSTVSDLLPYGYTVVVVDDGSLIPARAALQGLGVYYLRHNVNLGQGAALQTGNEFALASGAEVVVHFDADGQHSASLVEQLVAPILRGEVEVTFGSRFLNPVDRMDVPVGKRLLLKLGVFISWVFTKVWLSDTHNGFRALSRTAAERIRLREPRFAHATEILDLLRRSRLPYAEIPTKVRYTEYSMRKGQRYLNGVSIVIDLMLRRLFK